MSLTKAQIRKLEELNIKRDYTDDAMLEEMINKYELTGFNRGRSCERGHKLVDYAYLTTVPKIKSRIEDEYDEYFGKYKNPVKRIYDFYHWYPHNDVMYLDHCWGAKSKGYVKSFYPSDVYISVPYKHTIPIWNDRLAPRLVEMGCDVKFEYPCYYNEDTFAVIVRFPEKNSVVLNWRTSVAYALLYDADSLFVL